MGQQEYDNFKRLIKEWLDSHPDEYADFVEEMNDKKFKGCKTIRLILVWDNRNMTISKD